MNEITIVNSLLPIREYNGQRVVTFKDIDTVHQRPEGTARKRFNDNKKHFVENEDYFVRKTDEAFKEFGITAPNGLMLITESGYLMIVKSFTDDLSWKVQRMLVNNYFHSKELESLERRVQKIESKIDKNEYSPIKISIQNDDTIERFIGECCMLRKNCKDGITTSKLYHALEVWCRLNNRFAPSRKELLEQLMKHCNTTNKRAIRRRYHGYDYYIITLTPKYYDYILEYEEEQE